MSCTMVQMDDLRGSIQSYIEYQFYTLTVIIEAEEERDVGTCDTPNAFIQTQVVERDEDGNQRNTC